jgi:hypothetical protein
MKRYEFKEKYTPVSLEEAQVGNRSDNQMRSDLPQNLWKAEFQLNTMRLQTHHVLTGSLLWYLKLIKAVPRKKQADRVVKLPLQPLGESDNPKDTIMGLRICQTKKYKDDDGLVSVSTSHYFYFHLILTIFSSQVRYWVQKFGECIATFEKNSLAADAALLKSTTDQTSACLASPSPAADCKSTMNQSSACILSVPSPAAAALNQSSACLASPSPAAAAFTTTMDPTSACIASPPPAAAAFTTTMDLTSACLASPPPPAAAAFTTTMDLTSACIASPPPAAISLQSIKKLPSTVMGMESAAHPQSFFQRQRYPDDYLDDEEVVFYSVCHRCLFSTDFPH